MADYDLTISDGLSISDTCKVGENVGCENFSATSKVFCFVAESKSFRINASSKVFYHEAEDQN